MHEHDGHQSTGETAAVESVPAVAPAVRSRWWWVALIGLAVVLTDLAVWRVLRTRDDNLLQARFELDAEDLVQGIQIAFADNVEVLAAVAAFYDSTDRVEREEFRTFTSRLLARNPALQAIQWLPRVPREKRAEFEAALRIDVGEARIYEQDAQGASLTAGERAEYFPVQYVEPQTKHPHVLGLDHYAAPRRREVMLRARDRGEPLATPWFELPSADDRQDRHVVLIYMPVYEKSRPGADVAQRHSRLLGFVAAVVRIEDVVDMVLRQRHRPGIDVALFETSEEGTGADRFQHLAVQRSQASTALPQSPTNPIEGHSSQASVAVAGRTWQVVCVPTDFYLAKSHSWLPLGSLLTGLVLGGLLTAFVTELVGQTSRVERQVADRTAELRRANSDLGREIVVRQWAENELAEKANQLTRSNAELVGEIAYRERAEQALRDSEALYQSLVEHLPVGVFRKDTTGRYTFSNQEYRNVLGEDEEIQGKTDFEMAPNDLAAKYDSDDRQVLETGTVFHDVEQFEDPGGERRYGEVVKTAVRDFRGRIIGTQGIFWDVTARKQAEEELHRYAAELKRSNEQLEEFAYIASHDLQEPLRAISGYCRLLARRYQGKLDQDADEFIQFAIDGAARMQALIHALLEYSRVSTRGQPFRSTDLNESLAQVRENLAAAISENGATISADPLPIVSADPTQMVQLLQNLLSNAIRYRGAETPAIHVSAEDQPTEWLFRVRDNGIGIEPKYFERIFAIFQRLHTREEYPGTGIGLAICKKIVERHGGRIWVESEPGQGATFLFTLSKQEGQP